MGFFDVMLSDEQRAECFEEAKKFQIIKDVPVPYNQRATKNAKPVRRRTAWCTHLVFGISSETGAERPYYITNEEDPDARIWAIKKVLKDRVLSVHEIKHEFTRSGKNN
jgi:hypothetical protein